MVIDHHDARDGGTYRYIHRDDEGHAYAFHGVFHGEPTTDGMVQTFEFEGAPGHVSLDPITFERSRRWTHPDSRPFGPSECRGQGRHG